MQRHDIYIATGYDIGFGVYRGEVEVEYVEGDYHFSRTLNNPTQEEVDDTISSLDRLTQMVAQKNARPPAGARGNGARPRVYRNSRGQIRTSSPRSWRQGLGQVPGGQWTIGGPGVPAPIEGVRYVKHHMLPQAFGPNFQKAGVNHHRTTVLIPESLHKVLHSNGARGGQWNESWRIFFQRNPNPTQNQIYKHTVDLMMRYNLHHYAVGAY